MKLLLCFVLILLNSCFFENKEELIGKCIVVIEKKTTCYDDVSEARCELFQKSLVTSVNFYADEVCEVAP